MYYLFFESELSTLSSHPTLSYRKRGLQTTLQTSRQSLAGGLTAPPVALTLRYPRPIKGSGCFFYRLARCSKGHEPLSKGRRSRDVKDLWRTPFAARAMAKACFQTLPSRNCGWTKSTPKGQRLESHTKTLMERASSRNQLHPPHIGGGLGGGGCLFASFSAPEKVRNLGFGGIPQQY